MDSRERIIMTFKGEVPPDRIPLTDTAFWPTTLERWRKEGLPAGITENLDDPLWPLRMWEWLRLDPVWICSPFDGSLRLPYRIFEENEDYIVDQSSDGVKCRSWKKHYATAAEIEASIKTFDDWKKVRDRLVPDESRFKPDSLRLLDKMREKGIFTSVSPIEPCWYALRLLCHDKMLMQMVLEPDFIDDIHKTYTNFILGMLNIMWERGHTFDAVWFFSDLCYRNGMLFSPAAYRSLVMPYHKEIKRWCDDRGVLLLLHCDGMVEELIPLLIEAGFQAIEPLEQRAGNDLFRIKKKCGSEITLWGGINADILATNDKKRIEEEIVPKIEAMKQGGRYVYHIDHSVPSTVSLESYLYALDLVREHSRYS